MYLWVHFLFKMVINYFFIIIVVLKLKLVQGHFCVLLCITK